MCPFPDRTCPTQTWGAITVDFKSSMIKLRLRNDAFKLDIVIMANFQKHFDENNELFIPTEELMEIWPFTSFTMTYLNVLFFGHYFFNYLFFHIIIYFLYLIIISIIIV